VEEYLHFGQNVQFHNEGIALSAILTDLRACGLL
jgi:hypothetical protein